MVVGSENLPAIPLNAILEQRMIPSSEKVEAALKSLLTY
jgi:2-oxoisovalerate dehydrogenase E1 component